MDSPESEEFLRLLSNIKGDPAAYLSSRAHLNEKFVDLGLKCLVLPSAPNAAKWDYLRILSENLRQIIPTDDLNSKFRVFFELIFNETPSLDAYFKTELIRVCIVWCIEADFLFQNRSLFVEFVDCIFDFLSNVNNPSNVAMRSVAILGLREMELTYPGLLVAKVEHVAQLMSIEKTAALQSLLQLLTVLIHHLPFFVMDAKRKAPNDAAITLTNLLRVRTQPLKPLIIPSDFSPLETTAPLDEFTNDLSELDRQVTKALDYIVYMTPAGRLSILNVLNSVAIQMQLPFSLKKLDMLSDMAMQITLSAAVGSLLFKRQPSGRILEELIENSSCNLLPLEERLLILHVAEGFISSLPEGQDLKRDTLSFLDLRPWDSLTLLGAKLRLITRILSRGSQPSKNSYFLQCLQTFYHLTTRDPALAPLLFSLFIDIYQLNEEPSLRENIKSIILLAASEHAEYMPYVVNLIQQVREWDEPTMARLMTTLVDHWTTVSSVHVVKNLLNVLGLLEEAARVKCPQPTLKRMKRCVTRLLNETQLLATGTWEVGNALISLIRAVITNHALLEEFQDWAELLFILMNQYNNMDVRDRARLYYSVLCNLTLDKREAIFAPVDDRGFLLSTDLVKALPSREVGSLLELNELKTPVFKVDRVPCDHRLPFERHEKDSLEDDYWNTLRDADLVFSQTFNLSLLGGNRFSTIYNVLFEFLLDENGGKTVVAEFSFPVMRSTEEKRVTIPFRPDQLRCCHLRLRATFCGESSGYYRADVGRVTIELDQLFCAVPVECQSGEFFESLWKKLVSKDSSGCESITVIENEPASYVLEVARKFECCTDEDERQCCAILLPGKLHALLKLQQRHQSLVVHFEVEAAELLLALHQFLHKHPSSQHDETSRT